MNLNLRPPSWLWWMKLLAIVWNWSLSLITFLISLPIVLRSTISLNDLDKLYDNLLDFGIMMVNKILKWEGQHPNLIQVFVIVIMFFKHVLSLNIVLRYLYDNLFRPRVDILLYLNKALVNFSSENRAHVEVVYGSSLFRMSLSTLQCWAVIKVKYKACQRLFNSKHSWPLNLIVSEASSFCLLTQLISSHRPHFLFAISMILRSKNDFLVFLTVLWKDF